MDVIWDTIYNDRFLVFHFYNTGHIFINLITPWFLQQIVLAFYCKYNLDIDLRICSCHIDSISPLRGSLSWFPIHPVFGNVKYNKGFKRSMLNGCKKVEIEAGLLSIDHNLKKCFCWGHFVKYCISISYQSSHERPGWGDYGVMPLTIL